MPNSEFVINLYSSDNEKKKTAIYQILFDRKMDLLEELKKASTFEQDEKTAVLMAQVVMVLESFPRDMGMEKRILAALQFSKGVMELSVEQWKYLEFNAPSKMIVSILSIMSGVPILAQSFVESCLLSLDPVVRSCAPRVGVMSSRPTHFVQVLKLIQDKDPGVVKSAYDVISKIPSNEMGLLLEGALSSSDSWLLENIAPFLPLLVNEDLRWLVGKLQYHTHEMVAEYAKTALNKLNAQVLSKVIDKPTEEEDNEEEVEDTEEARLESELRNISMEEMQEFREKLELFDDGWKLAVDTNQMLENLDSLFPENIELDFEGEKSILTSIVNEEFEKELVSEADLHRKEQMEQLINLQKQFQEENEKLSKELKAQITKVENLKTSFQGSVSFVEIDGVVTHELGDIIEFVVEAPMEEPAVELMESVEEPVEEFVEELAETIDLMEASEIVETYTPEKNIELPETFDLPQTLEVDGIEELSELVKETDSDLLEIVRISNVEELVETSEIAEAVQVEAVQDEVVDNIEELESAQLEEVATVEEVIEAPEPMEIEKISQSLKAQPKPQSPTEIKPIDLEELPNDVRIIAETYPSFVGDSLIRVYQANSTEEKLEQLKRALKELVGFLNLCFIQSCIYFAQGSDSLEQNVLQSLKNKLTGPAYLRNLHNFVVALKPAHGSSGFFTFTLAGILSESSVSNPLMLMRELDEFLKNPIEPVDENLEEAKEGFVEVLKGVKCIRNNPIIMRSPVGARLPYADLTGPLAVPMEATKAPLLDLPHGEIVILSRDRTEALGLYPIIKYNKRRTFYSHGTDTEFELLYDRLEIKVN